MFQRSEVMEGMTVRSIDGEKLGNVASMEATEFHIEKGLFFPKNYACLYTDIGEIRNGEIFLTLPKQSLERWKSLESWKREEPLATPLTAPLAGEPASATLRGTEFREGDVTIPLYREKLEVAKTDKPAGEVRVRKYVVEEDETITVPVRHERVTIERRTVMDTPAMSAAFSDEEIVVPLRAEDVELSKRAYLDEEVVLHKEDVEEERRLASSVRHEELELTEEGKVDRGGWWAAPGEERFTRH